MAQIVITIPDAALQRVIDALCARGNWTPDLGITKAAYAKQQLALIVKSITFQHERQQAMADVAPPAQVDVT